MNISTLFPATISFISPNTCLNYFRFLICACVWAHLWEITSMGDEKITVDHILYRKLFSLLSILLQDGISTIYHLSSTTYHLPHLWACESASSVALKLGDLQDTGQQLGFRGVLVGIQYWRCSRGLESGNGYFLWYASASMKDFIFIFVLKGRLQDMCVWATGRWIWRDSKMSGIGVHDVKFIKNQ